MKTLIITITLLSLSLTSFSQINKMYYEDDKVVCVTKGNDTQLYYEFNLIDGKYELMDIVLYPDIEKLSHHLAQYDYFYRVQFVLQELRESNQLEFMYDDDDFGDVYILTANGQEYDYITIPELINWIKTGELLYDDFLVSEYYYEK